MEPPYRILLLADDPCLGGITSYVLAVHHALRADARFQFAFAAFPGRGKADLVERCAALGATCHVFRMSGPFDLRVLGQLRRVVREQRIDLIHPQGYRGNVITRLSRSGAVVVNTCHGPIANPATRLRVWQFLSNRTMRSHFATVACASSVSEWLLQRGLAPDKIRTIHNCVPPRTTSKTPSLRASLDAEGRRLVVLFAGRIVEEKGLDWFIDALRQTPNVTAILAGDGPLLDTMKLRAASIDAHFPGHVDDMTPYYEAADVVVLPSRMEALPMTLLEACAHGKPIVATDVGGISEIVRDGENGFLVPYRGSHQLVDGLRRLEDKDLRDRMGRASLETWRTKFSPPVMAEKLGALYIEALQARWPAV